ncbi:uncharacterized protein B0T15DRAFT_493121 [Chaetomium strumarium]|uniref:Uncharacterized protein n=1 Tax=Chaetomium strumarium TaxID=1170767 RepID=A0AAJ0GWY2_9PEZI|nr:hypothetical protein B0T15DRAFT_493121 [Chaetomium strumarium]
MSNNSTLRCLGPDAIASEATDPVPKDINYVLVPGTNVSAPWMVECCTPNPVSLIAGCYVWCEIPASRVFAGKDGKLDTDIDSCMRAKGRAVNESSITAYHVVNGAAYGRVAAARMGMKGLGVWVLLVSVLMGIR